MEIRNWVFMSSHPFSHGPPRGGGGGPWGSRSTDVSRIGVPGSGRHALLQPRPNDAGDRPRFGPHRQPHAPAGRGRFGPSRAHATAAAFSRDVGRVEPSYGDTDGPRRTSSSGQVGGSWCSTTPFDGAMDKRRKRASSSSRSQTIPSSGPRLVDASGRPVGGGGFRSPTASPGVLGIGAGCWARGFRYDQASASQVAFFFL